MADLVMNYDSLLGLSNEIAQAQGNFERLLADLDSVVNTMDGKWKGKAQVEFATAYNNLKPKLTGIGTVLGNYSSALSTAAANEEALEKSHVHSFSNVGIPSF